MKQGEKKRKVQISGDIEIEPLITLAEKTEAEYFDFRMVKLTKTSIEAKNGVLVSAVEGSEIGCAVRMLYKGTWGFFSTNDITKNGITFAIEQAVKLAEVAKNKKKDRVKLAPVKAYKDSRKHRVKKPPETVDIQDKYSLLKDMWSALKEHSYISSADMGYTDYTQSTYFVSSEGADIYHDMVRTSIQSSLVAKDSGRIIGYRDRIGATMGFELFDTRDPVESINNAAESAMRILKAKPAPAGKMTVIADPDLTGVFVHEAVGHATEADLVTAGESVLEGRIGETIGSDMVTIVDDPTMKGAFGSFYYDDEGVKASRKVLIRNGVLESFIQSRETAAKLGMEPNGGARAESYSVRPIVRMSNTLIEGGDMTLEEMLEGIKTGIYVKGTRGGQVDTAKGSFQFSAQEAYLIEKGEITKPLRDVSLSGDILHTLKLIDGVGKDRRLGTPGYCGKGQIVPVGDGGPHIRIKEAVVGGGS